MNTRIGVIGCGSVFDSYLDRAHQFPDLRFVACASRHQETAMRKAQRYGLQALTVGALLDSDEVDIVLNLTSPEAHAEVSLAAIAAGKHVYSEKPLATSVADARRILEAATEKGVRVGTAPDTVLGAGIRTARRLLDAGDIGRPVMGVCGMLSHGTEHWHPAPAALYARGGGPLLDFGPYHLAALVTLLGPISSVMAVGQIGNPERTITAPDSPRRGERICVDVLTTLQALLQFASGPQVSFIISWDAWNSSVPFLELQGTHGALRAPDPNWFGGDVLLATGRGAWKTFSTHDSPAGHDNYQLKSGGAAANYRGLGLADMVRAIAESRRHRASGELGLHVLSTIQAILDSTLHRRSVEVADSCERPLPMDDVEAATMIGSA